MVVVAFFGRRSSLVFDLSPSKKVAVFVSLSLSRFSLTRVCVGQSKNARERLNSIVACGYKTLNLKHPPLKKRPSFLLGGRKSPSFFPLKAKRSTRLYDGARIKKLVLFSLRAMQKEAPIAPARRFTGRVACFFCAARLPSPKIVARLYGGKRGVRKRHERCDRLGGVF